MSASPNGEDGGKDALGVITAGRSSGRLESELENVCRELSLVEAKVAELLEQQTSLRARRDQLSGEIRARKKRCVLSQCDWAGDTFEWSKLMAELLRDTFGLNSWRTNQKEIINATLSNRDAFVVMRTGGGKSLCYQLPAVLKGGITMRYLNDLVPGSAAMLSAGMDKSETANVYRRMRGDKVEGDVEGSRLVMVLVTPEKVVKSKMFMAALDKTAQSGRLSRVVIDEAHCCSQWGHDFRPEYCKLGILKRQFGHVPILAVTATCTDFIRDDVMKILNLTPGDVVCFKSSFNRSNLRYEVMAKPEAAKDALDQLASVIKDNYRGKAGIVYAFSRKEASDVATGLASRGVSAAFYHAGQEEKERSRVQQAWMRGDVPVVVATIAFGMGINHLEVRFVVHFSLSKSVENYYQESGRAGRDGKPSRCVVFYRPSDVSRQATLSCQDRGSQPLATLHKMVGYCQAMATCRRKMIAEALGEQGGKGLCNGGCDVCSGCAGAATNIDATRHATTLVRILRHLASKEQRVTPRQLVEAWRAKKGAKAMPDDIVGELGRPTGLSRSTCERLVLQLLGMGVLSDDFHFTAFAVVHYVVTGARAHALESGRIPQVLFQAPAGEGGPDKILNKAKNKASAAAAAAAGRRGKGRGAAQREEEEDLEGAEASVANASATGRLSGESRGGVRLDGKREPDKKVAARGDQGKARKRPRAEADLRTAQCTNAAGVVDLCGSGDDDSSDVGFQGDGTESGKRSRRVLAEPESEQEEEGDCANGDEGGWESNGGGRDVGGEGGSSSFAAVDVDDDDSDDFEPVRRKRKSVTRGKAAVQEDLSS